MVKIKLISKSFDQIKKELSDIMKENSLDKPTINSISKNLSTVLFFYNLINFCK